MSVPLKARIGRWFGPHLLVFLVANSVLTGANIYTGSPWWAFWPLVVWSVLIMLHYLYHRATTVDESWVEERTLDLRSKSYDAGHIQDIRKHPAPSITEERPDLGKR